MTEPTQAELALIVAKAKCFETCGAFDPADTALAAAAHEPHRAELEAAYAAFAGASQVSNPAAGATPLEAHLLVDSGLN